MAWRVAESLDELLKQINELAPNRSKESDGGIGDAEHASRSSDHNPWVAGKNGIGVVTARDFTHDPAGGCDAGVLAACLVENRDPRVKYIIWNRHIINSRDWVWRPYTGINPHNHHVHVSVEDDASLYDNPAPWALVLPAADPSVPAPLPVLRKGSTGPAVERLQQALGVAVDGKFGPATQRAVMLIQQQAGIVADGIVGPHTWSVLPQ